MTIYYKATCLDGVDFHTGTVDYAGALATRIPVVHPDPSWDDASGYLSVSVEPAETLIGGFWPCRLFEVEPIGEARQVSFAYPHKRAVLELTVTREVEAWKALGPNGEAVTQFIARAPDVLRDAARRPAACSPRGAARDALHRVPHSAWSAARGAAWTGARCAARHAAQGGVRKAVRSGAWDGAWGPAWNVSCDAARCAVDALLVRDLITSEQFSALTEPWKVLTGGEL